MKKNIDDNKKKKLYLPLSILVTYSLLILLIVICLLFIGPVAIDYIRWYLIERIVPSHSLLLIFFTCIFSLIFLVWFLFYMNERIKRRSQNAISDDTVSHEKYGELDSNRSYLEQEITELTNKLLATQQRWEEVNHLILSSHNKNINNSGVVSPESFLENFNIDPNELSIDKRLIFLLTPFHQNQFDDYKTVKNACSKLGFNTIRGDEELIRGDILSQIIRYIIKSRIIIANINGRNPNVFYELGIAHALNKPTILISHIENDIPFDLKTQYVIIYKDEHELSERLEKMLLQILID